MKTLAVTVAHLCALLMLDVTALSPVWADEAPASPAPSAAPTCEATLSLARSYNDILKSRADHYELDLARQRAALLEIQAEVGRLKKAAAEAKPAAPPLPPKP